MQNIANYIANVPELSEEYTELLSELNRNAAKAQANRALYDAAREVALATLAQAPDGCTATELYESCADELPEGFTKSKLQYALTHYWNDAVAVEKTKDSNMYRVK